jgi:peptidoglycan hydrolase-like protein with peptidoglycan-binding domain
MMRADACALFLGVFGLSVAGCTSPVDSAEPLGLGDVSGPLSEGDEGPEVRVIHDYLNAHGYFENAELRAAFPNWSPVVTEKPTPDRYDAVLARAVAAYQRLNGLEESGVADEATLELMAEPRCGTPDVDLSLLDESQKYALNSWSYATTKTNISYGFTTTFTAAQKTAVRNALNVWAAITNLTFTENTSTPSAADMKFEFGPLSSQTGFTTTSYNAQGITGSTIRFNSNYSWATALPIPSGSYDLQHTATHESGHGLGLGHSTLSTAMMFASYTPARTLSTDDSIAISLKYSPWQVSSWTAQEITGGGNGKVYRAASPAIPGGLTISEWHQPSQTWNIFSTTIGATELAAGNGELFFAKSDGTVWKFAYPPVQKTTPPLRPTGGILDLAWGGGYLWALGGSTWDANCGYRAYRMNSSTGTSWTSMGACGVRIAVEPNGRAWVTEVDGGIKRYDGSGTASSDWITVSASGAARQVGISPVANDTGLGIWKVGWNSQALDTPIASWNEQSQSWNTPRYGASGAWVAVASRGQPWLIGFDGVISKQRRD